ncbi:MAG TPA: PfkB family carbohydrate kinase [Burkholderiaceae bacterium]|nr:PfkB family carbohydrate kinase [Burkholderiaceae bacterium]
MPPRFACMGAANWDHKLVTQGELRPASSNPVSAWPSTPGGVARNLAENLVALGADVALACVLGDDPAGHALHDHARRHGIDTRPVLFEPAQPTGSYTAVLNPQGGLEWAFSAMPGSQNPPPDFLPRAQATLEAQGRGVADLNLPQSWLQALVDHAAQLHCPLALVAVSEAKMANLPQRLEGVALLVLNQGELAALGDTPTSDGTLADLGTLEAVWATLHARGLQHLLVTRGAEGAAYSDGPRLRMLPAPHLSRHAIADVTGAGDAFSAAAVWTLMGLQQPLAQACEAGILAAMQVLTSRHSALPSSSHTGH